MDSLKDYEVRNNSLILGKTSADYEKSMVYVGLDKDLSM